MNKRIAKKIQKAATVRDCTPQEAWEIVVRHMTKIDPGVCCYFVDDNTTRGVSLHSIRKQVLVTKNSWEEIQAEAKEPFIIEDTNIFKCQECGKDITTAEDVDYDGHCKECATPLQLLLQYCTAEGCLNEPDPDNEDGLCTEHMEKQVEEWAAELYHQDYEYKQSKL